MIKAFAMQKLLAVQVFNKTIGIFEILRAIPDKKPENFKWGLALMVSDFHETFRIC